MIINDEISYVSALTSSTLVKDKDIVRASSNGGVVLGNEQSRMTRVRQFGLYPLWTLRNLRGFGHSTRGPA